MPPKKKTANGKNGKEKPQKRESVASEGEKEITTPKSDESKSVDEYSEVGGGGGGSRRSSKLDQKKEKGIPSGIDAEAEELQEMKNRRQKLERTTEVLNKHDFVVQKLIMKAREDLVIVFHYIYFRNKPNVTNYFFFTPFLKEQ